MKTEYAREIEKKFTVNLSPSTAIDMVEELFTYTKRIEGESEDMFWKAPKVDFVRLRENTRELTVKVSDLGTVTNRIEENTVVDSLEATKRIQTLLFGDSCLSLYKRYAVYYVDIMGEEAVVSVYTVDGDPDFRTFVEVEAPYMADVNAIVRVLEANMVLKQETRSLFEIFSKEAA